MTEDIIIVRDNSGDVIALVRPADPLNPQFSIDEIKDSPDLSAELMPVSTMAQHRQYEADNQS